MELSLPPSRFRRTVEEEAQPLSRYALAGSVAFHVSIVVLGMVSVPYLESKPIAPPVPIMVDFIQISEETASPKISPTPPKVVSKEPPKQAEAQKKPQPKTNKAQEMPDFSKPLPPKLEIQETKVEEPKKQEEIVIPAPEKPKPKPEKPKIEKPKEEPKKPQAQELKPDEVKPLPEKPAEKVVEQPKPDPFASILKNLADVEDAPSQEAQVSKSQARFPEAVLTRLGATLSMSEQDALRSQLAKCWNILPGARDAQNLVVEVALDMNPDATVRRAEIVNKRRYNSDSFFRAAADSALRAVRHPYCTPLRLPLDKYSQWRTITISFDPREMF